MAPQIVQDVVDWVFGRRRRKKSFYGNRAAWSVPGYGLGGRRASDRLLPEKGGEVDMGRGPVGQEQKVIDFDGRSSIDNGVADQGSSGLDDEFAVIEDEGEGVTEQGVSDIADETYIGGWSVDKDLPDIESDPGMEGEKAAEQKVPDIDDKYIVDEVTGIRVLRFADTSPAKKTETVDETRELPVTEKQISIPEVLEVAEHTPELPISQEIYKEGDVSDMHYVARNNDESSVVRQLHPDCSVIIPADYDGAIEEIRTCPLDCPYKALEFAEIDQKTLRSRMK